MRGAARSMKAVLLVDRMSGFATLNEISVLPPPVAWLIAVRLKVELGQYQPLLQDGIPEVGWSRKKK